MPSYYIVLEKEIPNLDVFVNGNHLSRESKNLESIAKKLGVKPLLSFFSTNEEELSSVLGDASPEEIGIKNVSEQWFSAEEGLQTVVALRKHLEKSEPTTHKHLISNLREFERVLSVAQQNNIRWHLAIDY